MLLEYWFAISRSCVRWGSNSSEFYRLTAGVRQGGDLSPCLYALYVNDVIIKITSCGIGCHLGFACVNIILYADDILLLAHYILSLQVLLYICESKLNSIDMIINANKSNCLRIDLCWNSDVTNVKLTTRNLASIEWSNGCRYLGIFATSGATFKYKFDAAKDKFYRSFNAIMG